MDNEDIITTFKKIEDTHDQLTRLSQHESVKKFFLMLGDKNFSDYCWNDTMTKFEMSDSEVWDAQLDPNVLTTLVSGNKLFNGVDPLTINTQGKFSQFLFNLMMKDVSFVATMMRVNSVTNLATSISMLIHAVGLNVEIEVMTLIVDLVAEYLTDFLAAYEKYTFETKKRKNDDVNDDDDTEDQENKNRFKRPNNKK